MTRPLSRQKSAENSRNGINFSLRNRFRKEIQKFPSIDPIAKIDIDMSPEHPSTMKRERSQEFDRKQDAARRTQHRKQDVMSVMEPILRPREGESK